MTADRCTDQVRSSEARRGRLRRRADLASLTAWGVGGAADVLYEPADIEDLRAFLAQLPPDEPMLWLGLGSNLLVRDAGVAGTVIHVGRGLGTLSRTGELTVRAEAGVPGAKLARFCASHKLHGAEFFAGIPGTVGGALAMNAGAFGGETWPLVEQVETIDRAGQIRLRDAAEFEFGYRHLDFPPDAGDEWFVAATLRLARGSECESRVAIRSLLRARAASQPTGQRSCGSVFRNPPADFAGRLVEHAGLKGLRIGGAVVSSEHANFIINEGEATAADIESLIEAVRHKVHQACGVSLVPEVRIVGRTEA